MVPLKRRPLARATAVLSLVLALASAAWGAELAVTSDFEGGSAEVNRVDALKGVICVSPAGDPDRGWPCWWYFQVRGIKPTSTITLELDMGGVPIHPGWAMPQRAAFSLDRKHWQQTAPGERQGQRITYRQQIDAAEAWFAWGPPFLPSDAAELVRRLGQSCPDATPFELCKSLAGRAVPALRIARAKPDQPPYGVVVVARQHAWETGASWVCCGLAEWLVSDDVRAESLRTQAELVLVPVMDVDNVAEGQGGKNQKPHDHNRDWSDQPRFPAVAAVQREIRRLESAGRFHLYLDLHNPGFNDLEPFFNSPLKADHPGASWDHRQRFLAAARAEMTGPIVFKGRAGETGPKYDPKAWQFMSEHWVRRTCGPQALSLALETPWNTPASTLEGYRAFGRQLGQAIARYFAEPPAR